jgi:membrane protein DedA with SNARE-associated domain
MIDHFVSQLNYTYIFLFMAMESSLFPIPSEGVMIPAWYLAKNWQLNLFITIIVWWLWSLLWAIVNYFVIGQYIWKPILLKYWKYLLITEKKYHKAENLFLENDKLYTFLWRFIPVVRHLISIPAWIFKMNFWYFCILTLIWATIWCAILAIIWYYFWQEMVDIIHKYTKEVSIVVFILMIIWIYKFIKWKK